MTDPNMNKYEKVAADNIAQDSFQLPSQVSVGYIVGLLRNLMATSRTLETCPLGQ